MDMILRSLKKRRTSKGLLILIMFLSLSLNATPKSIYPFQCNEANRLVTEIGKRKNLSESFTPAKRRLRIDELEAKYLRVRVRFQPSGTCQWNLTVRDGKYRVVEVLSLKDFTAPGAAGAQSRWTSRIPGRTAFLDFEGCDGATFPTVGYDQYLIMPDQATGTFYSSQNPNDPQFKPLYESVGDKNKPLGDYVGFLMGSHEFQSWACSGVMVAPDLFLTNWHCGKPNDASFPDGDVWGEQIKSDTIIDLSWDDDSLSREYSVVEVIIKDKDLDFALLKVQAVNSSSEARSVVIKLGQLASNENIVIVHHPAGRQKQISSGVQCKVVSPSRDSWIAKKPGVDFTHRCDTESGSSGAPVFNESGELVGLHHQGFDYNNSCKSDKLNKAVNIAKIYDFIRAECSKVGAKCSAVPALFRTIN
jgi:Trypsin-like peptidase domain